MKKILGLGEKRERVDRYIHVVGVEKCNVSLEDKAKPWD